MNLHFLCFAVKIHNRVVWATLALKNILTKTVIKVVNESQ